MLSLGVPSDSEPGYNEQPRQSRHHSTHRNNLIEHVGPPLMQQPLIQQLLIPPQQQTEPKKKYITKYYNSELGDSCQEKAGYCPYSIDGSLYG
jgi:hypothetical protein